MHDTFTLEQENERLTALVAELEEDLEQHSENWRVKAGHLEQERDRLREALEFLVDQIDRSKAVDDHGHQLKNLKALADARAALHPTEPAPEAKDA